jgi:hypothetical protein
VDQRDLWFKELVENYGPEDDRVEVGGSRSYVLWKYLYVVKYGVGFNLH